MPYLTITSLSKAHVRQLQKLFQKERWSKGRALKDIQTMLKNSDAVLGILEKEREELIGFCRVITDRVYKAMVFDVIIKDGYRGTGLGHRMLKEMLKQFSDVKHIELYCAPGTAGFYKKLGFAFIDSKFVFLRKSNL